jgi:hypothetical protein
VTSSEDRERYIRPKHHTIYQQTKLGCFLRLEFSLLFGTVRV